MRQVTAIVLLSGAIVLAVVVFGHWRAKLSPSSRGTETAETNPATEQPLPPSPPWPSDPGAAMAAPPAPQPTNLLARMARGEELPPLRPEQLEAYLQANHRGVESWRL